MDKKPQYYECGICSAYHPADWDGDCRDDANSFMIEEIEAKHGRLGWEEIEMPDGTLELTPEKIRPTPKIDVSSHFNSEGEMYLPSYPFGILQFADMPGEPHREIASTCAKTLREACQTAEQWCNEDRKRAVVFRRKDGLVRGHYGKWPN